MLYKQGTLAQWKLNLPPAPSILGGVPNEGRGPPHPLLMSSKKVKTPLDKLSCLYAQLGSPYC